MSTVHREPSPVHSGGHGPRFRAGDPLFARAYALAEADQTQEAIAALLAREFSGQAYAHAYQNPAAIAVMAIYRERQQRAEGRRADLARLRAKGLPSALADRDAPAPPPAARGAGATEHARASPASMSRGLVAFAEAHGFACAYCGRTGGAGGDPDGAPWHRNLVEGASRGGGRLASSMRLACGACKAPPDRRPLAKEGERGGSG